MTIQAGQTGPTAMLLEGLSMLAAEEGARRVKVRAHGVRLQLLELATAHSDLGLCETAKCEACGTFIQFDIDHFIGVTLSRCKCHGWQAVPRVRPRRVREPMGGRASLHKERLDKATRRRRVLHVLPTSERAAITVLEISAASKVYHHTARLDLTHFVDRGLAFRKTVRAPEGQRGGYYKHVFWRAA